jgi:hypothetical protein
MLSLNQSNLSWLGPPSRRRPFRRENYTVHACFGKPIQGNDTQNDMVFQQLHLEWARRVVRDRITHMRQTWELIFGWWRLAHYTVPPQTLFSSRHVHVCLQKIIRPSDSDRVSAVVLYVRTTQNISSSHAFWLRDFCIKTLSLSSASHIAS